MDNLTHSLVGAVLGRMGLKRLSPYAMSALIISANLPDADSFVAKWFGTTARTFHRGFTHGVGGLVVLPFLTIAIILIWQRLRPSKEGLVKPLGLLLACFIGTLSHPLLDFTNTYGVRLLEPLSNRWFYGDTLFIMDPWIWIALILGLELSWRAERLGLRFVEPFPFHADTGAVALHRHVHRAQLDDRAQRRGHRPLHAGRRARRSGRVRGPPPHRQV